MLERAKESQRAKGDGPFWHKKERGKTMEVMEKIIEYSKMFYEKLDFAHNVEHGELACMKLF